MKHRLILILAALLAMPSLTFAQASIVGGGSTTIGPGTVTSCTINSVVYIDGSGNLACGGAPAATIASTGAFSTGSGLAGTAIGLSVSNGTSTGAIAVFSAGATPVVTIANGGATTFAGQIIANGGFSTGGGSVALNNITTMADSIAFNLSTFGSFYAMSTLTPGAPALRTATTANSWHILEAADLFDFNNGACGTSACTDPSLIIHSAVQDTTQYNHQAVWGQAGGALKTLTESLATAVVRIPVAALEGTGGKLTYRVKAADATDVQIREGEIRFAVVNKAGTETCTLSGASEAADGSVIAASVGTLTYAITCDTTPLNAVDIAFNALSSLTQTTLNIQYFVTLTGVGQPARQ